MSRDEQLPASSVLRTVHPKLHTPWVACIVVTVIAAIPLVQYAGATYLAIAATGMIYLSYALGGLAILRARLKGWPKRAAPFSLGRWGIPVSILGLIWGVGMLVNFAWPRAASNPTPRQTGSLLNFHWHRLDNVPVLWTVSIVVVGVGAIYFVLVQRRKPSHIQAPEGELVAQDAAPAAAAT
jgi:amino acid transporter